MQIFSRFKQIGKLRNDFTLEHFLPGLCTEPEYQNYQNVVPAYEIATYCQWGGPSMKETPDTNQFLYSGRMVH